MSSEFPACKTISRAVDPNEHQNSCPSSPSLTLTCHFHPAFKVTKLCRQCSDKFHFLLCEKCLQLKEPVSHLDHIKQIVDIDKYIENCLNNWENIQNEEIEAKSMFAKLEEFIEEADSQENIVESFVENEIKAINFDFDLIMTKLEEIKINVLSTKDKFVRTLTEELKEMRKLKDDLGAFADEGSPLFRRKSAGVIEDCMNKLKELESSPEKQKENDYVIETFSSLVREFKQFELNFELNYKKDYIETPYVPSDLQIQKLSKREASMQIMTLINEIRNKAKYPPKYKRFQNSNQEFDNFLKTLDVIKSDVKGLSEKLLLTQQEVTYKLTGENLLYKASFSSNNNAILLKSEEKSRLPQSFEIATSIKTDHRKGITCICVYDNQSFITGGNDALIKIWDLYTFKCSKNLKCETVPYNLITMIDANEEKLLVSGHAQGYVAVFNSDFDLRFVFKKQESIISSLISIDDRRTVFSGSYDGTILILDIIEGRVLKKLSDHEASVNCLGYSKSLSKWASGSDDGRILIWDIQNEASKNQIENLKEKPPNFLEDPDMDSIESDHFSEEKQSEVEIKVEENHSSSLTFLEKEFIEQQAKSIVNTEKEKVEQTYESDSASFRDVKAIGVLNNGEEVKHIVFSQNNPRILLSTCYNLVKLWDIQTKSCLMRIGKHEKCINRLLIIEEKSIKKLYEPHRNRAGSLSTNNLLLNIKGNSNLLELMSIDRLMILSFGVDHMIRMWNGAKNCCVSESHDHIKEFSLKDSLENTILMYNEKDDKVYFLSVGDKDTIINIWKMN